MIRSMLVVPPTTPGLLDKSLTTEADALMIELEDGVHDSRKAEARQVVADFITRRSFADKMILIRVNDASRSTGEEDLRQLAALRAPAVILPKVRSHLDVERADEIMKRAETDASVPVGGTQVWVMVETTDAVLNLDQIASAPRVTGLTLGSGDLSAELRVRRIGVGANRPIWSFPLELLYAKQRAVLIARSRGLTILDTGYTTFRDLEGTAHAARVAAQMGFDGAACFSPKQITPIHNEFTPSYHEYEWACRAVAALADADQRGETVVVLDGEMIEGPLLRSAQSVVYRYENYAARDRASAERKVVKP